MPCHGKIAPYFGETCFLFFFVINLFGSGLAHLKSTTWVRILGMQSSTHHRNKTTSPNTILCYVHSVVDVICNGFQTNQTSKNWLASTLATRKKKHNVPKLFGQAIGSN